jgi:hypothetical protein
MPGLTSKMKTLLLEAPPDQIDPCLFPMIAKMSEPAKAIEILEVLDAMIYEALGSGFAVELLTMLYDTAVLNEGTTHDEIVKGAHWRQV